MKKNEISVTILSKDFQFSGNIKTKGDLRIEGTITGTVLCQAKVIIDTNAKVIGPISAKQIELLGTCNGNVLATQSIHIGPKAILIGDLTSDQISVGEGAIIEGSVKTGVKTDEITFEILDEAVVIPIKKHIVTNDFMDNSSLKKISGSDELNSNGKKAQGLSNNSEDMILSGGWI